MKACKPVMILLAQTCASVPVAGEQIGEEGWGKIGEVLVLMRKTKISWNVRTLFGCAFRAQVNKQEMIRECSEYEARQIQMKTRRLTAIARGLEQRRRLMMMFGLPRNEGG